jgi:hypothetical protein
MTLAHEVFHMPYHDYLKRTSEVQRMAYMDWYALRGIKESFAMTPEDKRADFLREKLHIESQTPRESLDTMIAESLAQQRAANEAKQRHRQNGRYRVKASLHG